MRMKDNNSRGSLPKSSYVKCIKEDEKFDSDIIRNETASGRPDST